MPDDRLICLGTSKFRWAEICMDACFPRADRLPDVREAHPNYMGVMCGRVIQSSGPFNLAIVHGMNVHDSRASNYPRRYNAAPSQELLVIRRNRDTGEVSLDPLRWGLIPYWCKDPKGGRKPINAKAETVANLPMFRDAYARRRCILPVDGFFEWKAIKGLKAKQPFAIAMRDGSPFGLAGIWENWKDAGERGVATHVCDHHGAAQRAPCADP